jgi:hypothetical protein
MERGEEALGAGLEAFAVEGLERTRQQQQQQQLDLLLAEAKVGLQHAQHRCSEWLEQPRSAHFTPCFRPSGMCVCVAFVLPDFTLLLQVPHPGCNPADQSFPAYISRNPGLNCALCLGFRAPLPLS